MIVAGVALAQVCLLAAGVLLVPCQLHSSSAVWLSLIHISEPTRPY